MTDRLEVSQVRLRIVENGHDGLLAWASCVLGDAIKLDNIAVRRGRDGGLYLSFPAKRTAGGSTFHYFHPISREAADLVERAIMARIRELSAQYRPEQEGTVSER